MRGLTLQVVWITISLFWIPIKLIGGDKIYGLSYIDQHPVCVEVENGLIVKVSRIAHLPTGVQPYYLSPGLFDNQVNGGGGVYFSSEEPLRIDQIEKVTRHQWASGVTSYFPTLTSHTREVLVRNLKALAQAVDQTTLRGSIAGFHLEGPYLSPEDGYRGVHARDYIRPPDWDEFNELYKASGGKIRTITLAPEIPGALEFIKLCAGMGVTVALGHHNAPASVIRQAVQNGARVATHLGNGCANLIDRHTNPLWPQLAEDSLMISIIADGFHLNEHEIRTFYKAKGQGNVIITSDITRYAGLAPGTYRTADGREIELTPEGKVQYKAQKVLAGSALAINTGVRHLMKVTGASLYEAIGMASSNVAKLYGFQDRGELKEGMRGDIILFTLGPDKLEIQQTFVGGRLVFDRSRSD